MPQNVYFDETLLREVFMNLISNAIRYTRERGSIAIAFKEQEDTITVSVQDNGIGIPATQRTKIFEQFFRADNAMEAEPQGNGLGLTLARALVELWGGTIWFESEEGKGTTFFFTIAHKPKIKTGESSTF